MTIADWSWSLSSFLPPILASYQTVQIEFQKKTRECCLGVQDKLGRFLNTSNYSHLKNRFTVKFLELIISRRRMNRRIYINYSAGRVFSCRLFLLIFNFVTITIFIKMFNCFVSLQPKTMMLNLFFSYEINFDNMQGTY